MTSESADLPAAVDRAAFQVNGRPIAQWPRIEAGRSDDLTRSQTSYTQRGRNVRAE